MVAADGDPGHPGECRRRHRGGPCYSMPAPECSRPHGRRWSSAPLARTALVRRLASKSSLADSVRRVPFVAIDPRTPVLVGSGQFLNHAASLDDALEPADLMARAIELAAADAGLGSPPDADSIRVVSLLTWKYGNPALIVAERLGLTPRETAVTTAGRQQRPEPGEPDGQGDPRRRPRPGHPHRRRGVAVARPGAQGGSRLRLAEGARERRAPPDRRGPGDEPSGRGGPQHRHAGAGVPDVRDRRPRRGRARPSTSTR